MAPDGPAGMAAVCAAACASGANTTPPKDKLQAAAINKREGARAVRKVRCAGAVKWVVMAVLSGGETRSRTPQRRLNGGQMSTDLASKNHVSPLSNPVDAPNGSSPNVADVPARCRQVMGRAGVGLWPCENQKTGRRQVRADALRSRPISCQRAC